MKELYVYFRLPFILFGLRSALFTKSFPVGDIVHRGYGEYDDGQRILPTWVDPTDLGEVERIRAMKYIPYHPNLPEARPRPPEKDGPPCPHVWESHETVDELYKLLDTVTEFQSLNVC